MAKKILLAEDSITMQKVVQMTFAAEGFTGTPVSTADGAIQQARELTPDVLIADLSMEGKNGYDICSAVKADPDLGGIPVLLLHGNAVPYDANKGKAAKADGEITKPFETQALIDKVKALAEAGPSVAKEPMGPIESLAPPMGGGEDIVIDTSSLSEPAKPAAAKPVAKPMVAKPAVAKPAVAKPVVAKPVVAKPVVAKPAVAKPAKPAPPPLKPPKPAPRPAPAVAQQEQPVEITIEAEPPPAGAGGVSWDKFDVPGFDEPPRTDATLLGVGKPAPEPAPPPAAAKQELPPPPPGMPLPGTAKPQQPLQPGQPYEPAVYEAITKLSRDVIERIVWEVVPDLAEEIIREELDRLVEKRRSS